MGLYDSVRCEYPLRNPLHQELEYQTKDLECALGEYTITREGKLVARPGRLWAITSTRSRGERPPGRPPHAPFRSPPGLRLPHRQGSRVGE